MKQTFEKTRSALRGFFGKAGYGFQRFMTGRYGMDELYVFLNILITFLLITLLITRKRYISFIILLLLGYNLFRSLSRNSYKRSKELAVYLAAKNKVFSFFRLAKNRWKERKTHRYYVCPKCRAHIRIPIPPRGKKISITCPKCGQSFIKKT